MPNFSSLARLEVPEKFLWWGRWGGWGLQSHFRVQPNNCVEVVLRCVVVRVVTIQKIMYFLQNIS